MPRPIACVTAVLATLVGCAAQTDGTNDASEAWNGREQGPGGSGECGSITCASRLPEDKVIECDRHVVRDVVDQYGVHHNESLYAQLGQAAGIDRAQLQPRGRDVCASPSYDCNGVFYTARGLPARVPPLPARATLTDVSLARWKMEVAAFYESVTTDPLAHAKLSPGKAQLCTTFAYVVNQTHPAPSIVEGFTMLQVLGAESSMPDHVWLDGINAASIAAGCGALPLPPGHDMDSWFVPEETVRGFIASFGDCNQATVKALGRCPHPFDAPRGPGNFVNARNIVDARACSQQATWSVGDPTGGCGMSCYRN